MSKKLYKIEVNSLLLKEDIYVRKPLINFGILNNRNRAIPFLSSSITEQDAIKYGQTKLAKGLHLHFILPEVFLRSRRTSPEEVKSQNKHGFLPVLNRWAILKKNKQGKFINGFLVESDYLSNLNNDLIAKKINQAGIDTYLDNPITFLPLTKNITEIQEGTGRGNYRIVPTNFKEGDYTPPLKVMGQTVPFEAAVPVPARKEENYWEYHYKTPFTSQAYGLQTFPIFYPNCFGVFGFHDRTIDESNENDFEFEIVAWNHETAQLANLMEADEINNLEESDLQLDNNLFNNAHFTDYDYFFAGKVDYKTRKKGDAPIEPSYQLTVAPTLSHALNTFLANDIDRAKKEIIENTLEAAEMGILVSNELNPEKKYRFRKHEAGFHYKEGNIQWKLFLKGTSNSKKTTDDLYLDLLKRSTCFRTLDSISQKLDKLNNFQNEYDEQTQFLTSRQYNLFADWYRYVQESHALNPNDDILNLLRNNLMLPQKENIAKLTGGPETENSLAFIAAKIKRIHTEINDLLKTLNGQIGTKLTFELIEVPYDKYYQPKPVGLLLKSTDTTIDFQPMLIDWKVQLFQFKEFSNKTVEVSKVSQKAQEMNPATWQYKQELFKEHLLIDTSKQDFVFKDKKPTLRSVPSTYQGLTLLSNHVVDIVKYQLEAAKEILDNVNDANNSKQITINEAESYINQALAKLEDWEGQKIFGQALNGLNQACIMRNSAVQMPIYDAKIDGVTEGPYLIKQISEAIDQQYTEHPRTDWVFNPLRNGVFKIEHLYLMDSFGRYPKKNGGNEQFNVYQEANYQISSDLETELADSTVTGTKKNALLPTRFIQPTRIAAYWLKNDKSEQPVNNIPINNPICGWVIANNLDQSLVIYNSSGALLGQIKESSNEIIFEKAIPPFGTDLTIKNEHLKKFIENFKSRPILFFKTMHDVINQSLENIHPATYAEHPEYLLFASRPIALVRAMLRLETADAYYSNQSSNKAVLNTRKIAGSDGDWACTNGYEKIKIPVQIGHNELLEDGIIGYWYDSDTSKKFYAPTATLKSKHEDLIILQNYQNTPTEQSDFTKYCPSLILGKNRTSALGIRGQSEIFTMLMDPRGSLTAMSRILPVAKLKIPPILYKKALEQIKIYFAAFPVLSSKKKVHLPLMRDANFSWRFLEKREEQALITDQVLKIKKNRFEEGVLAMRVDNASTLYNQLMEAWNIMVDQNWLTLDSNTSAEDFIINRPAINFKNVRNIQKAHITNESLILAVLDNYSEGILPPITHTHTGFQEIREGWLQLKN